MVSMLGQGLGWFRAEGWFRPGLGLFRAWDGFPV